MTQAATEGLGDQVRRGREEVRDLGGEFAGIADDLKGLARTEVQLAKAEMGEQVGFVVKAAIWGGVAAILALVLLFFVFLTVMFALDTLMPLWAAALVTTAIVLLLTAFAAWMCLSRIKQISVVPKRTMNSIKEDVRWAKAQLSSSSS